MQKVITLMVRRIFAHGTEAPMARRTGPTLCTQTRLKDRRCVSAEKLIYGSGCVRFLPPEKWFGYPGCRAGEILPAFGQYMRQKFDAPMSKDLFLIDQFDNNVAIQKNRRRHGELTNDAEGALKVAFAVEMLERDRNAKHSKS